MYGLVKPGQLDWSLEPEPFAMGDAVALTPPTVSYERVMLSRQQLLREDIVVNGYACNFCRPLDDRMIL